MSPMAERTAPLVRGRWATKTLHPCSRSKSMKKLPVQKPKRAWSGSARRDSLRTPLPHKRVYDIVLMWKSSLKSPRILSMEALLLPLSVRELRLKQTLLPICVRWLKMQSNAISTMQNKCRKLFACISSVTNCCRYEAAARCWRKPANQSAESARLFHRPPAG